MTGRLASVASLPVMIICPRPAARYVWDRWPRCFAAMRREQLRDAFACRLVVTNTVPSSPKNMEDDLRLRRRAARRRAYIDELLPMVRLNPLWSDDEALELAESMAEMRMLDEEER